eukprot:2513611-Amphidinium_carterae.1
MLAQYSQWLRPKFCKSEVLVDAHSVERTVYMYMYMLSLGTLFQGLCHTLGAALLHCCRYQSQEGHQAVPVRPSD